MLVRPSYVLGGRAMKICNNRGRARTLHATSPSRPPIASSTSIADPILVDKFLLDAVEVDVDAVSDYG